jgi:hypothetical protein
MRPVPPAGVAQYDLWLTTRRTSTLARDQRRTHGSPDGLFQPRATLTFAVFVAFGYMYLVLTRHQRQAMLAE